MKTFLFFFTLLLPPALLLAVAVVAATTAAAIVVVVVLAILFREMILKAYIGIGFVSVPNSTRYAKRNYIIPTAITM